LFCRRPVWTAPLGRRRGRGRALGRDVRRRDHGLVPRGAHHATVPPRHPGPRRMSLRRGRTAIVGTGEVPTGRFPDRSAIETALQAARLPIRDAGIEKDEVDCVIPATAVFSFQFSNELTTCRLVEELGLTNVAANATVFSGGSSSTIALRIASALIETGRAR